MSKRKARRGGPGPLPKMRGTIGYVRPGGDNANVKGAFMYSTVRAMHYEMGMTGIPLGFIDQQCGSGQLVEARNDLVDYFLKSEVEWLWMVDTDMGFAADTFSQLVASADPVERPVMGALCFGLAMEETDETLIANRYKVFPTIYVWKETETAAGFQEVPGYPRNEVVQCDGTGAACFVVHRSVLEKIRDQLGPVWFDRLTHPKAPDGKPFGEDLSFFARCAMVGVPVHVDTRVKTSHCKGGVDLTEEWWDTFYLPAKAWQADQKEAS